MSLVAFAHALIGVDQDREYREQEDNDDLRLQINPEPQDEQRDNRNQRRRVKSIDRQVERPVEPANSRHRNAKRDADDDGGNQAVEHDLQALRQKVRQFTGDGRFVEGDCDLARRGEKDWADKGCDDFPDDQDGDDKAVAVERGVFPPRCFDHSRRLRVPAIAPVSTCWATVIVILSSRHPARFVWRAPRQGRRPPFR